MLVIVELNKAETKDYCIIVIYRSIIAIEQA